jgi:hypothetical protein
MAIVKQALKRTIIEAIYSEIASKQARYYYYMGRTVDFIAGPDIVETPESNVDYESKARTNMVLLKLISPADVCLVLPRVNWEYGKVFNMYDVSAAETVDTVHQIYCLSNATNNVYKCLWNAGGIPSVNEPNTTDLAPQTMADGYVWKFMYNLPLSLRNKFLTGEYMPVTTSLRSRFFSNGSIDSLNIEGAGSGYSQGETTITVSGDGTGAILEPIIVGGQLVSATITQAGSGYTHAVATVNPGASAGMGAQLAINLSTGDYTSSQAVVEMLAVPGTIDNIILRNSGSGMSNISVTIEGDGTGAELSWALNATNNSIAFITITNPGRNYNYANIVITANLTSTGVLASAVANVSPPLGHGRNASEELFASALMFYGNLTRESYGGVKINNDYRQYGIIRSPRGLTYGTNLSDPISTNSYAVTVQFTGGSNITNFPVGTIFSAPSLATYQSTAVVVGPTSGMVLTALTGVELMSSTNLTSKNLFHLTGTGFNTTTFAVGSVLTDIALNKIIVYGVTSTTMEVFTVNGTTIANGAVLRHTTAPSNPTITATTSTTTAKSLLINSSQSKLPIDSDIACACYSVSGVFNNSLWAADTRVEIGSKKFLVVSTELSNAGVNRMLLLPLNSGSISPGEVINIPSTPTTMTALTVMPPNVDKTTGSMLLIDNRPAFTQTSDQTVSFRTVLQF